MKEIFLVTGLGIGEETKSQTVEWLTSQTKAHTVIRKGGSQCGHHVVTDDGIDQELSHFGAGTFEGARTHLTHMVINPVDLFTEAIQLEEKGVENPFDLLTIDKDCLAVTPFQGAMSRFREIMRGSDKKGTVGKGVGEALKDARLHPGLAIYARDFTDEETLSRKVEGIRKLKIQDSINIIDEMGVEEIPQEAYEELENLRNERLVTQTVEAMKYTADLFKIVDDKYFDEVIKRDGSIVSEPSHGALLDPKYGFSPHVTQVDPTQNDIFKTLGEYKYDGRVVKLGVMRCYMTRHGAGPLVSFSPEMTNNIHETHNAANPRANEWLGEFRNGFYDSVAINYAIKISGGKEMFDGLSLSYLDELNKHSFWEVCVGYKIDDEVSDINDFFEIENGVITEIKLHPDDETLEAHQRKLTQLLNKCRPVTQILEAKDGKSLEEVFIKFVEDTTGIPVAITSYGPKKRDRSIRPGWEKYFA